MQTAVEVLQILYTY